MKFTPTKGKISIKVVAKKSSENYPNGHVALSVRDNGLGINSKELKNIFARFYQSDNQNKKNQGVGIGLSFSQSLAKIHGGKIGVKSKPNEGSTFTLELPLGAAHLTSEQMIDDKEFVLTPLEIPELKSETLQEVISYENSDKPVLLIIEDNLEINHYIASELSDSYSVISCVNGSKGLKVAREKSPDVIISDIMMPVMNGIEFLKALRAGEGGDHPTVIFCTTETNFDCINDAITSGANEYVMKPFDSDIIQSKFFEAGLLG